MYVIHLSCNQKLITVLCNDQVMTKALSVQYCERRMERKIVKRSF